MRTTPLAEYRCVCSRLLFKGLVLSSRIEIKCKRCGAIVPFGPAETPAGEVCRYGVITDKDGKIKDVSESMSSLLGYSPEELCTMRIDDLSTYAASKTQSEPIRLPTLNGTSYEHSHRTKKGATLPVRARTYRVTTSGPEQIVYLFESVPERELLLHDAPPAEGIALLQQVAEATLDGTLICVNKSFCDFLSKDTTALMGSNLFDLVASDYRPIYQQQYIEMGKRQAAFSLDKVCLANRKEDEQVRVLHTPTYRDDGSMRGYSIVFQLPYA